MVERHCDARVDSFCLRIDSKLLVFGNPLIHLKGQRDLALSNVGDAMAIQSVVLCVDVSHSLVHFAREWNTTVNSAGISDARW